jgi:acyl-CoA thioesterase-1
MRTALMSCVLIAGALGCARGTPDVADSANAQASGATTGTSAAAPAIGGPRTILFVGTSLTAGYGLDPDEAYPQQVQQMIDSAGLTYQVVNAGVSGETSSSLLRRMEWLLRQPFEIIVVETGANDGLRGIPVETMRSNIQRIIELVKTTRPGARIVLAQMEAPPNLGRVYTQGFREVFPDLASRNNVLLLPFILEGVAGRRELNQADGIHPNLEGERIVARNVWKGLRPLLN